MSAEGAARLCQRIGARIPVWTQGAGGNISCKEGEGAERLLWIKASGKRLDAVSATSGLACARLASLAPRLAEVTGEDDYAACLSDESIKLPGLGRLSMETGFHALLGRRTVIHFHALSALLMADAARTEPRRWSDFLKTETDARVRLVPPVMPGLALSRELAATPDVDIFLLANHGVVLHSEAERIVDDWSRLELAFCRGWHYDRLATLLASPEPQAEARKGRQDREAPLAIYFPDTAVFRDRLENELEPVAPAGRLRRLPERGWRAAPDLAELWLATLLLAEWAPNLPELPDELSAQVAGLPTEKWRRGERA